MQIKQIKKFFKPVFLLHLIS